MPRKRKAAHLFIFLVFYQPISKLFSNFEP
jgi:hypothetical protein